MVVAGMVAANECNRWWYRQQLWACEPFVVAVYADEEDALEERNAPCEDWQTLVAQALLDQAPFTAVRETDYMIEMMRQKAEDEAHKDRLFANVDVAANRVATLYQAFRANATDRIMAREVLLAEEAREAACLELRNYGDWDVHLHSDNCIGTLRNLPPKGMAW